MSEAPARMEEDQPSEALANREERKEIIRLARRLPHRNAVRQIAFGLLEGKPVDGKTLRTLLAALQHPLEERWRERAVAAWAVGQIPLEDAEKGEIAHLLGLIVTNRQLSRADRLVKRGIRSLLRTATAGLIAVILYVVMGFSGFSSDGPSPESTLASNYFFLGVVLLFGSGISCLFVSFFSFGLDASHNNSARSHAARSLGLLGQPLSIGALAAGAQDDNDWVSHESMCAFRKVLPELNPAQYGHHSPETVPALCKMVFAYHVPQVTRLAVIMALGKIGDGKAVKPVEKIAKSACGMPLGEAAERVLPILRERQKRENDPLHLVRAAAPSEPANRLLRPAQDSGSSEESLLLRSISSDEE